LAHLEDITVNELVDGMLVLEVFPANYWATEISFFRAVRPLEEIYSDVFVGRIAAGGCDTRADYTNRNVSPERLIRTGHGRFDREIRSRSTLVTNKFPSWEQVPEIVHTGELWT